LTYILYVHIGTHSFLNIFYRGHQNCHLLTLLSGWSLRQATVITQWLLQFTSHRSLSVTAYWGFTPSVQTWSTIKGVTVCYLGDPLPANKHHLHGNASVPLHSHK